MACGCASANPDMSFARKHFNLLGLCGGLKLGAQRRQRQAKPKRQFQISGIVTGEPVSLCQKVRCRPSLIGCRFIYLNGI